MSVQQITVNVDGYLALNKYEVDEANAHIELVEDPSDEEFDKLVMVCPAALYKREPDGTTSFDYAGCPPWEWNTVSVKSFFRGEKGRREHAEHH